ncbi:MAG: hypothetical protein QNI96_05110 [Woeseiaceae bacterium]|nr:hypothetical protein [Woeseiaceae bacterium]
MNFVLKVLVALILAPWALIHVAFLGLLIAAVGGVDGAAEIADLWLKFVFN